MWRPVYIFDQISLNSKKCFRQICRQNQNTHFVYSNIFFIRKSCPFRDNVKKYCRPEQATDDNTAHARYMLDTQVYEHTHSEYVWYLWLIHCINVCTGAPHCYVLRTLPELFTLRVGWWVLLRSVQKRAENHVFSCKKCVIVFRFQRTLESAYNIF